MKAIEVINCSDCPFSVETETGGYGDESDWDIWSCQLNGNQISSSRSEPEVLPLWCPLRAGKLMVSLKTGE